MSVHLTQWVLNSREGDEEGFGRREKAGEEVY